MKAYVDPEVEVIAFEAHDSLMLNALSSPDDDDEYDWGALL